MTRVEKRKHQRVAVARPLQDRHIVGIELFSPTLLTAMLGAS